MVLSLMIILRMLQHIRMEEAFLDHRNKVEEKTLILMTLEKREMGRQLASLLMTMIHIMIGHAREEMNWAVGMKCLTSGAKIGVAKT